MSNEAKVKENKSRIKKVLRKLAPAAAAVLMTAAPAHSKDNSRQESDDRQHDKKELAEKMSAKVYEDGVILYKDEADRVEHFTHDDLNTYTAKQFKKAFKKLHKNDPEIIRDTLSAEEFYQKRHDGSYDLWENKINVFQIAESEQELKDSLKAAQDSSDLQKQFFISKLIEEKAKVKFTEAHEAVHAENHKILSEAYSYLTPEQTQKLLMIDEITATMGAAKLTYDTHKHTGNLHDIDGLNAGELMDFKVWMLQNPNSSEQESLAQLGASVYKNWLNKYNHVGSVYYENTFGIMQGFNTIRLAGAKYENDANRALYIKTANKLLKNTRLGDLREVVDINFTLDTSNGLYDCLGVTPKGDPYKEFMDNAAGDSKTVNQATRRIRRALGKIQNNPEGIEIGKDKTLNSHQTKLMQKIKGKTK